MKKLLVINLILGALLFAACKENKPPVNAANTANTANTAPVNTAVNNPASNITRARIGALHGGMDYRVIVSILGVEGTPISKKIDNGDTLDTYEWKGRDFDSIILIFRNNKFIGISQPEANKPAAENTNK